MATAPLMTANSFGLMVQAQAGALRNIANEPTLLPWLEELANEKLGASEQRDERQALCARWLATVGRKAMIKEGATEPYALGSITPEPAWIAQSLASGKSVQILCLSENEREALGSALDWMRDVQGPALNADWSKVSLPQALEAEKAWVEQMAKKAELNINSAAVLAGTHAIEGLQELGFLGVSFKGFQWVELKNAEALSHEGGTMRHCVGSYWQTVSSGRTQIYSLRDPEGKPRATVESNGLEFVQLKMKFNKHADQETSDATNALIRWKIKKSQDDKSSLRLRLSSGFSRCCIKINPIIGFYDQDVGMTATQKSEFARWTSRYEIENPVWAAALSEAIASNIPEIIDGLMPPVDQPPSWMNASFDGLAKALRSADSANADKILQRVEVGPSNITTLCWAIEGGSLELIARLGEFVQPGIANHQALKTAAMHSTPEAFNALMEIEAGSCARPFDWEAKGVKKIALPDSIPEVEESIGERGSPLFAQAYLDAFPSATHDKMFLPACEEGNFELMRWLIDKGLDQAQIQEGLYAAARADDVKMIGALLALCDPLLDDSKALIIAAKHSNIAAVSKLLPVSEPKREGRGERALAACLEEDLNSSQKCAAILLGAIDLGDLTESTFCNLVSSRHLHTLFENKDGFNHPAYRDEEWIKAQEEHHGAMLPLLEKTDPVRCLAAGSIKASAKGWEGLATSLWSKAQERCALDHRTGELEALLPTARQQAGLGGCDTLFSSLGGTSADLAGMNYEDAIATGAWPLAEMIADRARTNPAIKIPRDALAQAAEFAPLCLIKKLLEVCDPLDQGGKALIQAVRGGRIEAVELLLPDSDPSLQGSEALRTACLAGRADLAALLLPQSDPRAQESAAISACAKAKNWDMVEMLWPMSDPNAEGCYAMSRMILARRLEFVERHLDECDPSAGASALLRACSQASNIELAKKLLPFSEAKDKESDALRSAVINKDHEMVALLAPWSDVHAKYSEAVKRAIKDSELEVLQELLPYADPDKSIKLIKAEGFDDEAEAMLIGLLGTKKSMVRKPKW